MATTPFIANLIPPSEPILVRLVGTRPAAVELKLSVDGVPREFRLGTAQAPATPPGHSQQVNMQPPFYDETVHIHEWGDAPHGAQAQVSAKEGDTTHLDTARILALGGAPIV